MALTLPSIAIALPARGLQRRQEGVPGISCQQRRAHFRAPQEVHHDFVDSAAIEHMARLRSAAGASIDYITNARDAILMLPRVSCSSFPRSHHRKMPRQPAIIITIDIAIIASRDFHGVPKAGASLDFDAGHARHNSQGR